MLWGECEVGKAASRQSSEPSWSAQENQEGLESRGKANVWSIMGDCIGWVI